MYHLLSRTSLYLIFAELGFHHSLCESFPMPTSISHDSITRAMSFIVSMHKVACGYVGKSNNRERLTFKFRELCIGHCIAREVVNREEKVSTRLSKIGCGNLPLVRLNKSRGSNVSFHYIPKLPWHERAGRQEWLSF